MSNNYNDYIALTNIIEKWDLNRITSNQLVLLKTIASGGQGKVKLGQYYNMNVIVKILHKLNPKSFTVELLNAYKYRHPNIPKFLGVYESYEHYGIVMEYVDGVTMTKLINLEKQGRITLSLIQKLDYLIQLANVIEFLHSHSLMHRDLKTDNIIIDHLGTLKLIDFGIALPGKEKWINMDSPEYSLTPNYMAPEIALQAQEDDDEEYDEEEDEDDNNNEKNNQYANEKKYSETYNKRSYYSTLEKTKTKFNQLAQTEEFKYSSNWNTGKWILITNKYDIWTFGIIMAQLFTRCKPWCRNERENINEMEAQTRLISNLPYPLHVLHPNNECKPYESKIKDLIKKCLLYDPDERIPIEEAKKILLEIFDIELHDKQRTEKMKKLQNKNKENKQIKDIIKNMKEEDLHGIIRFNKLLIRKEIDIESINKVNNKINNNYSENIINKSQAYDLLLKRINEQQNSRYFIGNSLLDSFQKLNIQKAQNLRINEHKIFEMNQKLKQL